MGRKQHNRLPEKQSSLVYGFKPRTEKQRQLVELIEDNEIVIAKGVPGSGKTYVALATALGLVGEIYKKVILVKSVTTIPGEEIGFLKGGMEEKMEPFMMSYVWNIDKICGEGSAQKLIDAKVLQVLPLAYIRGLSIDNSVVIFDEVQNMDNDTFKTIITRIGEDSKYIFLGDVEQVDRKRKSESCLEHVLRIFSDSDLIKTLEFADEDCVRNPKIPKILAVLRENSI